MITGIVVAVDPATAKVRVQFPDRDGVSSDWLPVGQRKTLGDFDYWLPELNTQVVCMMDENLEAGVVLCAIYSDADLPPVADPDLFYKKFADGTVIQYDRKNHKLQVDVAGDVELKVAGNCNATIDGHTVMKSQGGIDLDGGTGNVAGSVQGECVCPLIGGPHLMVSATVKESL